MSLLSRTRNWGLPLLALIALVFALYSVLVRPAQTETPLAAQPPKSTYAQTVAGIGVVEPRFEVVSIASELAGVVRDVFVLAGDEVTIGQPLFVLDQRDAEARIKTLLAALQSAEVQAADANDQWQRVKQLNEPRAVAVEDVNRRKFAAQLARARVQEIRAQLSEAETTLDRLTVRAPSDGRILDVNVRPGEFAQAGPQSPPLMSMGDMSQLHVRVEVDEEDIRRLNMNAQAVGYVRGDTSTKFALTYVDAEPLVRGKQNLAVAGQRVDTRVMQVIFALPQNATNVFVGQQMDVFIEQQSSPDTSKPIIPQRQKPVEPAANGESET